MTVFGVKCSAGECIWKLRPTDERLAQALAQKFEIPEVVARLLPARGIDLESAESFLYPTLKKHLPNPFSLKDMEKAAQRMADAIAAGDPVGLMGDYDVDGATSTAILKMFLEELGIRVLTYIPERDDGYGPNALKMQAFKDAGCRLVATLDCGTTAFEAIDAGTRCGLDVIILDHHEPEKKLPNAYAVVNPKRLDEPPAHPCRYMAAVGVVFLFIVALNSILRSRKFYQERAEPNLIRFLDCVAFGTVCDVVKLQGVNRLLVKSGLQQMRCGQNKGLAALSELINLAEPPTAYHLGYIFGPRVNACGRIGKSDIGMRLLASANPVEAAALAHELDELNAQRRDIEAAVLLDAIEQVESKPLETPFIIVQGDSWHQGVVGIVAGRLKERYHLPVFALSVEGDEVKGSSRSIPNVDLGALIMNALEKGILTRGGGHPMAAGFSLSRHRLDDFRKYLIESIPPQEEEQARILEIDGVLDIGAITPELAQTLNLLAPFGESNPEPRFALKEVFISRVMPLKNGHIACTLAGRGGQYLPAIAFRVADTAVGQVLLTARQTPVHVAGSLKLDSWKGQTKIQFHLHDIALAE